MHDPPHAGAPRLGDHVRDARDIHLGEALLALGGDRDRVHERVAAAERTAERLRAANVRPPDVHAGAAAGQLTRGAGALADERADLVPIAESRDERATHEAVGARDRDTHQPSRAIYYVGIVVARDARVSECARAASSGSMTAPAAA